MPTPSTCRSRRYLSACATLLLSGLLLSPTATSAQTAGKAPAVLDLPAPAVVKGRAGRFQMANGTSAAAPTVYRVPRAQIHAPVAVIVATRRPERPLAVDILKFENGKADQTGRTDARGVAVFRFRTEGEFLVRIAAAAPGEPFDLMIWHGEEAAVPIPPAYRFAPREATAK